MRFQTDDIITKNTSDTFSKVQGILGNKVLVGAFLDNMSTARYNKSLDSIFTEADLAECTIVERDGKSYEPEKWAPKKDEAYYYPCTISSYQWAVTIFKPDHQNDIFRRDNGLCHPHTDEGKDAAIAHAKRMLAVK